jgi:hypothetical protein
MNLALILDVLLIFLLLATIVYAMVLHRRLAMLRSEKEGLETFLDRMSQATAKADASLKGIRQTAEQAQAMLNDPMVKAQALRDELLFLIDRADGSAERLAAATSGKVREEAPAAPGPVRKPARRAAPAPAPQPEAAADDGARSQAERDLMNALRNVR